MCIISRDNGFTIEHPVGVNERGPRFCRIASKLTSNRGIVVSNCRLFKSGRGLVLGRWGARMEVVGMRGLSVLFDARRIRAGTLGRMAFRVRGKRFITVVKPSNYKGSALLGVLKALSAPASNSCLFRKGQISGVGRGRLATLQGKGVNFVFRDFGLVSRLAMCRGIRLPLICLGVGPARHGERMGRILRGIGVLRHTGRLPRRLSNKRRRHITVTHTMIAGTELLLTSRPANGLSSAGKIRIVRLLDALGGRKAAVVVIARSRHSTTCTRHVVHLLSNGVVTRGHGHPVRSSDGVRVL